MAAAGPVGEPGEGQAEEEMGMRRRRSTRGQIVKIPVEHFLLKATGSRGRDFMGDLI